MRRSLWRLTGVLNHDFCPWANHYVYWLKQPIGWFVLAAAAALAIGVSVAPHALVIFAAISVVIVLGVAWPWIGVRGIDCELSFDRKRVSEGSSVLVRITVTNRWPWPLWGLTVERGFFLSRSDAAEQIPAACLARIPAWSRTTFTWDFEPQRRGRYPSEAPRIASGFPFGIWQGHRQITVENELLVWPRMASLQSVPPIQGRSSAVGGTPNRHVGHEGDMSGLRSFRNGDSLRHVHWAQTAKHDRLVVCERQTTGHRRVQLVLDGHKEAHPGCEGASSLEEMIRVGASIGRQFHAHNANVDVRLGRQTVVVTPGSQGLNRLLDALAIWLPLDDSEAKSIPGAGADDRSLLVVVTTDRGAGRWTSQLLRSRGAQLVILRFGTADDAHEVQQSDEQCRQSAREELEARPSWLELDGHDDVLARLVRGTFVISVGTGVIWNTWIDPAQHDVGATPLDPIPVPLEHPPARSTLRLMVVGETTARGLSGAILVDFALVILAMGLAGAFLPFGLFQVALTRENPLSPLLTAAVSVLLYVNPVEAVRVVGLTIRDGFSVGAAFSFLVIGAGSITAAVNGIGREFGWRRVTQFAGLLLLPTLAWAYAADRFLPHSAIAQSHTHAFDNLTRLNAAPHGLENLATIAEELWQRQPRDQRIGLWALGGVAVAGVILKLAGVDSRRLMRTTCVEHESAAEARWNRALTPTQLIVAGLVGLCVVFVGGLYVYYPAADSIIGDLDNVRFDLDEAIRAKNRDEAEARIDEFRELASRLPVSVFLRKGSVVASQRVRQGELIYSLDTLDEFVKENQFGEAKAAFRFVMDSYRTCREEHVMSGP